jgi:serine-type D-Ala-D-Ala carboxypeptidase/endopeptidase (penicillin-binding protein 4)
VKGVSLVVAVGLMACGLRPGVAVGQTVGVGAPPVTSVDGPVDVSTSTTLALVTSTTLPGAGPVPAGSAITTTTVSAATTTISVASTTSIAPATAIAPAVSVTTSSIVTGSTVSAATSTTKPGIASAARPPATADELRVVVTAALASSTASTRSVEVNVDGIGAVVAFDADQGRAPASTQKLYVAAAVMSRFGPEHRFVTEARTSSGVDAAGTVVGQLVLRAGGDPGFSSTDLAALATAVAKSGVKVVQGGLALDDAIFDTRTRLEIWKPSFTPGEVGALSAFVLDGNHRSDLATLADPGLANLRRFRAALTARGVIVAPGDVRGHVADGGPVVGRIESPPLRDLVIRMLKKSDNTYAEVLLKHLGVGSTTSGTEAIAVFFNSIGVPPPVRQVDGSGLSLLNRSTAHQQVLLVRKLVGTTNGTVVLDALPIACVDGTLRGRFCATVGASVVKAKTGAIDNVIALTGLTQTASGRRVVFSFLLNGTTSSSRARASIDKAIVAVSSSTF